MYFSIEKSGKYYFVVWSGLAEEITDVGIWLEENGFSNHQFFLKIPISERRLWSYHATEEEAVKLKLKFG